jgi:hypothetical protein
MFTGYAASRHNGRHRHELSSSASLGLIMDRLLCQLAPATLYLNDVFDSTAKTFKFQVRPLYFVPIQPGSFRILGQRIDATTQDLQQHGERRFSCTVRGKIILNTDYKLLRQPIWSMQGRPNK